MEPAAAVAIAVQIADALEAAHAKGILHRDIKPSNVMLIGRGHVKVLDFGLAKQVSVGDWDETITMRSQTQAGQVLGTPAYLSPEVLQGEKADARSDLWALGVVLYQMLSGRLPFHGSTALEVSSGILKETSPPLSANVPRGFRLIVERSLEKQASRRQQDAGEVRSALEALQATSPSIPARRTWLLAIGAIVIAAAGGLYWWQQKSELTLSTGEPRSANETANDLFEQGVNALNRTGDIPKAQEKLEQAVALDGHFAAALVNLAGVRSIQVTNGYSNDINQIYKADEELQHAVREAPDLFTLAGTQMAINRMLGRDYSAQFEKLEQIVKDHPSDFQSLLSRMIGTWWSDDNESAKKLAVNGLGQSSLWFPLRMFLAEIIRTEGDVAGAIREGERVSDQVSANPTAMHYLARAYVDHGELEKARRLVEANRTPLSANLLWRHTLAMILVAEGKPVEARQLMDEEWRKFAGLSFLATTEAAEMYARMGDKAEAILWLSTAIRNGDKRLSYFQRSPWLESLQKDPDFLRIINSVKAERKR